MYAVCSLVCRNLHQILIHAYDDKPINRGRDKVATISQMTV